MAVPPTRLPELVVGDDGTKTAFAFRGVVLGCKDLVIRIAGNADVEFPVTGLLINSSDSRLTDARAANAIKTLTSKAISAAADPQANNALVFDGTDWHPVLIVLDTDSRLTNDRTANKIRTSAVHNIATDAPQNNYALVFDGTDWHAVLIVRDNDSRLTNDRTANALRTTAAHSIATNVTPQANYGMVFDGSVWKPVLIVLDSDSRLTNDRTANALRTSASHGIDTSAPAAGHVLAFRASDSKWVSKLPAEYHSSSLTPTGTNSQSEVMMGVAGSITPTYKTRMLLTGCGTLVINANANQRGGEVSIRHGTGTAPSNGAAATGTQDAISGIDNLSTATHYVPFGLSCVVTGLTVGTTYWLDFGLRSMIDNTVTIISAKLSSIEI